MNKLAYVLRGIFNRLRVIGRAEIGYAELTSTVNPSKLNSLTSDTLLNTEPIEGRFAYVNDLSKGVYYADGTQWLALVGGSSGTFIITGDGTAPAAVSNLVFTLASTGVIPGVYTIANVTVDAKGRVIDITSGSAVTSIDATGVNGIIVSGGPITTSGILAFSLGDITPTSVSASGTVLGSNLSGTNTGNQTISLTGDVTGSGVGSFAATLANTAVTPGSYTLASITVDSKGRITAASTGTAGTVSSVSVTTANGVSGTVATPTTTPAITIVLGAITPTSVAASGAISGANLSGTNTGDNPGVTSVSSSITGAGLTTSGGPITGLGTLNFALSDDVAAIEALTGTGIARRTGTSAWSLGASVTLSELASMTDNRLLGRSAGSAGIPQEVAIGSGLSMAAGTLSATAPGGSVTSVSVTTANGVSGTVATATTTPAITLVLGAITPTSVNASGNIDSLGNLTIAGTINSVSFGGSGLLVNSGISTLSTFTGSGSSSGTNTGNQTITLTGDVTGSGTGSFAATLANTAVVAGSYTSVNITVDSKGRITAASSGGGGGGGGTVTSVSATVPAFLSISGSPVTTVGTLAIGLSGSALPVPNGGSGGTTFTGHLSGNGTGAFTASSVIPATDLSGNLAIARFNSGTSASSTTYWRGDGTWATPSDAAVSDIIFYVLGDDPSVKSILLAPPGAIGGLRTQVLPDKSGDVQVDDGVNGLSISKLKVDNNGTAINRIRHGLATLVAGTVTVSDSYVTGNTRFMFTSQGGGTTPGFLRVNGRSAGTSFTISSSNATDTDVISWVAIEP